jgi:hypothetical protein
MNQVKAAVDNQVGVLDLRQLKFNSMIGSRFLGNAQDINK